MIQKSIYILLILACSWQIKAQETAIFQDIHAAYKQGMYFYEEGLFGEAQQEFLKVIEQTRQAHEPARNGMLVERAKLHYAMCAIRLDRPDGERLILDFIREYEPAAVADFAKLEMGDYYYNTQDYENAIKFLERVDVYKLDNEQITELKFKLAYSYFVRQEFAEARQRFGEIKDVEDIYYYPSNYYYGITAFFENDYEEALNSFLKVNDSKKYSRVVPYYIAQIYFARKQYDEVIEYAEPLAMINDIKYIGEINKLVGSAYFENEKYEKALPFLQNYQDKKQQVTDKDVYQLAFAQYQAGQYEEAISNFEELREVDSPLGQNALYNLADSYLQTGDKNTARNVFQAAAKMNYDQSIQEACNFNYAKVSYDLGDDKAALRVLQDIPRGSLYYGEAQKLMSKIFLNSNDYKETMALIEKMPEKTPEIEKAYQKVAYYYGVQLYNDIKFGEAKEAFGKSLINAPDSKIKALALFWLGEMYYFENDYANAITNFNKSVSIAQALMDMPDEASEHIANYNIGYSYFKQDKFATATNYFRDAVNGLRLNLNKIEDDYVRTWILPDATLRTADCYFARNDYDRALEFYEDAIKYEYEGFQYAMYQRGKIKTIQNQQDPADGILAMEKLYENYADSDYADDAMYNVGETYLTLGRMELAADIFEKLLNRYPRSEYNNQSLLKMGLIKVNMGDNGTALEYYKRVFANNPNSQEAQDALNGIEDIYIEMDDPEGYITFKESIPGFEVSDSEKENIKWRTAEAHFRGGDYEKAAKSYSSFLASYPLSTSAFEAYYKRAESYFALKEYDSAYTDYRKVLKKGNSRYAEAAANKAANIAYNHRKDFKTATELYEQLLRIASTEDNRFKAKLGAIRSAYRGNILAGRYGIANDLKKDSRISEREKAEVAFYVAKSALSENKYEVALANFKEVISLAKDERAAEASYQIAYIYYIWRDLDTAQQMALNTSQISGYDYWLGKSVVLLGDIFLEKKDYFNARASLESIIENYNYDDDVLVAAEEKLAQLDTLEAENGTRIIVVPTPSSGNLEMEQPDGN